MPWEVIVHPDRPIVELRYIGLVSPTELNDSMTTTLRHLRSLGRSRVLGDCSKLEGGHSVVDLFAMVEALNASGVTGAMKEAVILPEADATATSIRFWETACYNRGMRVRAFGERAQALEWLIEP